MKYVGNSDIMSKEISIRKHGIKCPYCCKEIGKDVELDYETISLGYTKGGHPKSPSSTHQIIFCKGCGKIIEVVPHRITLLK